ncbi:sensor histidine kinase [Celeribacter sp.]|uniref:sensor histidine kinase n=1 Tax=Celeribacter sp. TaxID=1890673 RepID=UPI003A8DBFDF
MVTTQTKKQADGARNAQNLLESRFVHDLRASLRAVATLPDWIIEDLDPLSATVPRDVYRYLLDIKAKAHRADALLLSMREFCDLDGPAEMGCRIDSVAEINAAVAEFSMPDGFRVEMELVAWACDLPKGELARVVIALLDNACRHHGGNSGVIRVTNVGTNGAVHVSDDGQGIPEEFREKVFDPLTTLKPRDVVEGSGLGLSIARKRVERWGGTLTVKDKVGCSGATLVITLPVSRV